jgi:hypothetical protein
MHGRVVEVELSLGELCSALLCVMLEVMDELEFVEEWFVSDLLRTLQRGQINVEVKAPVYELT